MADGSSAYFATQARRQVRRLTEAAALTAALMIILIIGRVTWWAFMFVVFFALQVVFAWNRWRLFLKLGEAAKRVPDSSS
jgi:hypothetical protein